MYTSMQIYIYIYIYTHIYIYIYIYIHVKLSMLHVHFYCSNTCNCLCPIVGRPWPHAHTLAFSTWNLATVKVSRGCARLINQPPLFWPAVIRHINPLILLHPVVIILSGSRSEGSASTISTWIVEI